MRHRLNEIDMKGRVKVIDHLIIAIINPKPVLCVCFCLWFYVYTCVCRD